MSKDYSEITDYILNRIISENKRVVEQAKSKPIRTFVETYNKMEGKQLHFIEVLRQEITEKYDLNSHEIDNLLNSLTREDIIEVKQNSIIISVNGNSILQTFGSYSNYKKTNMETNKTKNPDAYWTSPKTILIILGLLVSIVFNLTQYKNSKDDSNFNVRKLICDSMLTVQQMKVTNVTEKYNAKVQENIVRLESELKSTKDKKKRNIELQQNFLITGIDEEGLKISDRAKLNSQFAIRVEALEFAIKKLNEIKE